MQPVLLSHLFLSRNILSINPIFSILARSIPLNENS